MAFWQIWLRQPMQRPYRVSSRSNGAASASVAADSIVSALMASLSVEPFRRRSAYEGDGQVGQSEEEGQPAGAISLALSAAFRWVIDGAEQQQGHPRRRGQAEGMPPKADQDACGGG